MPLSKQSPAGDTVRSLEISDFDLRFDRYRIIQPKADLLMARSLSKYSQIAPVVYCQLEGSLVLVDGFKRLRAVRKLKGITALSARLLEVDEQSAKAAIFNLNRVATRPNELEESLIIDALVHDDGLQQIEVAQMLGRHKSWINRRKASLGSDPVFGLQVRSSEVNMNACLDRFVFNTLVQYTMSRPVAKAVRVSSMRMDRNLAVMIVESVTKTETRV